jgi:hypothetical protein
MGRPREPRPAPSASVGLLPPPSPRKHVPARPARPPHLQHGLALVDAGRADEQRPLCAPAALDRVDHLDVLHLLLCGCVWGVGPGGGGSGGRGVSRGGRDPAAWRRAARRGPLSPAALFCCRPLRPATPRTWGSKYTRSGRSTRRGGRLVGMATTWRRGREEVGRGRVRKCVGRAQPQQPGGAPLVGGRGPRQRREPKGARGAAQSSRRGRKKSRVRTLSL